MGLQDRPYYQDSYSNPWEGSGGYVAAQPRSIIVSLIIINVAIFVLDMFFNGALSGFLALKPDMLTQKPWAFIELLTYGFAHAPYNSKESFFHVAGNMFVLFMLGRPVEQRLGRAEFLRFYLISVLVAAAGYLLFNWGQAKPMLGASGAVSAVVALFVFYYPKSTVLIFGVFPLKTWILGVVIVGVDLLRSLNPDSHIAWEAHLAGFAFGAAYFYFGWSFTRLGFSGFKKRLGNGPKLKLHNPEELHRRADEILEKINQHGEQSLTASERRTLKKYSKQLRKDR